MLKVMPYLHIDLTLLILFLNIKTGVLFLIYIIAILFFFKLKQAMPHLSKPHLQIHSFPQRASSLSINRLVSSLSPFILKGADGRDVPVCLRCLPTPECSSTEFRVERSCSAGAGQAGGQSVAAWVITESPSSPAQVYVRPHLHLGRLLSWPRPLSLLLPSHE